MNYSIVNCNSNCITNSITYLLTVYIFFNNAPTYQEISQGREYLYLVAYQVDWARYCASGGAGLMSGRGERRMAKKKMAEPHRGRMLGHRR